MFNIMTLISQCKTTSGSRLACPRPPARAHQSLAGLPFSNLSHFRPWGATSPKPSAAPTSAAEPPAKRSRIAPGSEPSGQASAAQPGTSQCPGSVNGDHQRHNWKQLADRNSEREGRVTLRLVACPTFFPHTLAPACTSYFRPPEPGSGSAPSSPTPPFPSGEQSLPGASASAVHATDAAIQRMQEEKMFHRLQDPLSMPASSSTVSGGVRIPCLTQTAPRTLEFPVSTARGRPPLPCPQQAAVLRTMNFPASTTKRTATTVLLRQAGLLPESPLLLHRGQPLTPTLPSSSTTGRSARGKESSPGSSQASTIPPSRSRSQDGQGGEEDEVRQLTHLNIRWVVQRRLERPDTEDAEDSADSSSTISSLTPRFDWSTQLFGDLYSLDPPTTRAPDFLLDPRGETMLRVSSTAFPTEAGLDESSSCNNPGRGGAALPDQAQ